MFRCFREWDVEAFPLRLCADSYIMTFMLKKDVYAPLLWASSDLREKACFFKKLQMKTCCIYFVALDVMTLYC